MLFSDPSGGGDVRPRLSPLSRPPAPLQVPLRERKIIILKNWDNMSHVTQSKSHVSDVSTYLHKRFDH